MSHRTLEGFRGRFGVQGCYLEGRNGGSCQKATAITYTNEGGKLYCGISGTAGRKQLNSGSIWNMEQSGFLSGLDVDFERRKSVMNLLWFLARRTWKVELSFSETGICSHKLRQQARSRWHSSQPVHSSSYYSSFPSPIQQGLPSEETILPEPNWLGGRELPNSDSPKAWES